jgi:hypothetical protein
MFLFSKTKRAEFRQKQKDTKDHLAKLKPYLPGSNLDPLGNYAMNSLGDKIVALLLSMVFASLAGAVALMILADPYENIARFIYSAWSATGRTADFQTLYAGFGASFLAWALSMIWGCSSEAKTIFNLLTEMDDRIQNQIAELALSLNKSEQESADD